MHVAVDLDDVVLDFWKGVLDSFNLEFGYDLEWKGPWDDVSLKEHPALREAGYRSWWDWMRDREWLWAVFPAVPGAIGSIKRLRSEYHYVECVTSKPAWAEHNVWKWLGKWRPPFNRVTIVNSKQRKLDFTSARVIIDDKPETCREWAEDGRIGIVFDRMENEHEPHPNLYVAHHWHDVVTTIQLIKETR